MRIEIYKGLPEAAKTIREEVFIKEQGFENEYDEIDDTATHIVMFDGDICVATCRVFESEIKDAYILGRLAVKKERRREGIGACVVREAEKHIAGIGGKRLMLHSQLQATEFYSKIGYVKCSEIEYEQGCPHIWMKKEL